MNVIECWLFVIPILLALVYLAWRRLLRKRRRPPATPGKPRNPPAMVGFPDHCRDALGRCAEPATLRAMTLASIKRRLRRTLAPHAELPPDWRIATWPIQAGFIADGNTEGLVWYQESTGLVTPPAPAEPESAHEPLALLDWIVMIGLLLLASAFLAWAVASKRCCGEPDEPRPTPPVLSKTLSFAADLLFEYNTADTARPFHKRFMHRIEEATQGAQNVRAREIRGYADPIGEHCRNASLARQRAEKVRQFLNQAGVAIAPAAVIGRGPSHADEDIWNHCLATFQDVALPNERPLMPRRTSRPRLSQCPSDAETWHPEMSLTDINGIRDPKRVSRIRINQRRLISCLSAMRRVDVILEYQKPEG